MRFLSALLVATLLIGCAGPQKTIERVPEGASDAAAPIGANRIVVVTDTPASDVYRVAARVLQREGYQLANTDADLQAITTSSKSVNTGIVGVQYSVSLSAGVIDEEPTRLQFTGQLQPEIGSTAPVEKTGQSGSAARSAWADLFTVAYLVSEEVGGNLEYSK